MFKSDHMSKGSQTAQTVLVFFWVSSRNLMARVALGFLCVQEPGLLSPVLSGAAQNLSAALLATALILP